MLNFLLHFWNRYFREPFDKQHGKRAQALLKSASQHVYYIHWSVASQLTWKKSLLLTCKILGLLFNTLATDEKYALLQKDNLTIPIQMQLSQKLRSFSQFFAAFLKYRLNFNKFQTKYDPQIFCLSEIRASENVVRKMSKKSRFRGPFGNNMLNVPKHCWNQHQSTFIIFNDQFKTIELVELFLIDTANLKTAS